MTVPTPVAGETLTESDEFWEEWADYPYVGLVYQARTLEEGVESADLVIRGHIVDVYIGETWEWENVGGPGTPSLYVRVAIGEVLQGIPVSRTPGFVEVGLGPGSEEAVEVLAARLPQHDNMWFLKYDLAIRPRPSINNSSIAPFAYLPLNDLQGVLRDIDGEVRVIRPDWFAENPYLGRDHFPRPLEGTSFDQLVEEVRDLAEVLPDATPLGVP